MLGREELEGKHIIDLCNIFVNIIIYPSLESLVSRRFKEEEVKLKLRMLRSSVPQEAPRMFFLGNVKLAH